IGNTSMTQFSEQSATDRAPAVAGGANTCQFVTFTLGEQQYCVDIMSVREIRASHVITPLPSAPAYVRGGANPRGLIVPIIHPRTRFGLGRTLPTQNDVVVIVAIAGKLKGLLVDGVSDILTVERSDIAAIPETDGDRQSPFFDGLITQGDTMLIVIALDRL